MALDPVFLYVRDKRFQPNGHGNAPRARAGRQIVHIFADSERFIERMEKEKTSANPECDLSRY